MKATIQLTKSALAVAVCAVLIGGVCVHRSHGQDGKKADTPAGNPSDGPQKIIIVDDSSYAPFAFVDLEGRPKGISIDIWRLWSRKTGHEVEFQLMEWESALMAVRLGKADVVGGLFLTPQRQEFFDFTKPYFNIATSIFFQEQLHGIRGLEDLGGFTVGVIKGDSAEELIQREYPRIRTESYPNAERLAMAARAGEIKVFVVDSDVGRFYLTKTGAWNQFREASNPISMNKQYAAVRKGDQDLLAVLQHGLDMISETEIRTIVESWTGVPLASRVPWPAVLCTFGSIAAVLCLMLLWNLQLKRKIAEATNHVRQRHEELQRSERNYREIFNATSDMIFVHDPLDGRILDMNRAAQEVTGYSSEELFGKSVGLISEGTPPFDEETALRWIQKAVSDGAVIAEWLFRKRNGETFWAEVALRCSLIDGEHRVLALIRDITGRKRVEETLRQSARRLSMAISATADAIWEWNLVTNETYYSPRWYEMLGYSDQEFPMTFDTWRTLCHPEDFELVYPRIQKTLESGESDGYAAEFRMRARDGSWVWILGRGNVTERNASGEPRILSGTNTDITRRKEIENQLREREDFARRVLNSVDAQLAVVDITGHIQDVNDAWRRLAIQHGGGDERKWGVGANYFDVCENASSFLPTAREAMDGLRQVQQGVLDHFEMEYPCELPDVVYWFTMRAVPLVGRPGTALVSHSDITDRREAQESILRNERRLRRESEAIHSLMLSGDLFGGDLRLAVSKITEVMADATSTERVSVWLYEEGYQAIRCIDLYERSLKRHSEGQRLISADFPAYVSSHQQGKVIAVEDVFQDLRTREIPEDYFRSSNIKSLLDAPVWIEDGIGGILCFEQVGENRKWTPEEERLASTVAMLIALCYAIGVQIKTEERLRDSEEKFRTIVDMAPYSIVLSDEHGRYVDVNQALCKFLGFHREDIIGRHQYDFLTIEDHDYILKIMQKLENFGMIYNEEVTVILNADHSQHHLLYSSRPVKISGERLILSVTIDLTDRKLIEEELKHTAQRLTSVISSLPVILFGLDRDGIFTLCEGKGLDKLGLKPGEVMGKSASDVYWDYPSIVQAIHQALEGRLDRAIHDLGEVVFDVSYTALRDEDGELEGVIGVAGDITEWRRAEEALRESEERLRNIIDTSFDGIIIHDAGRIIDINENPLTYLGYERDEVIGRNLLDFFAADHLKETAEKLRSVAENPAISSARLETRIVGRSGKEFDVEYFSRGTRFHGKSVRVVAFRDITERKEAERTLKESEFRFRTFYNSNPEGVVLIGLDGKILDVNRTLIRKSGYLLHEVVNHHFLEFVPERYHKSADQAISSIKSGLLQDDIIELAYIRKDGEIFPIAISGWLVTDEESNPISIGVFIHDLSQEKKLLEEKESLMSQLVQAQKMEAIGTLAGGIAHDFNNILSAIIGYTELSLMDEPADPSNKKHAYLSRVLDAGKRAKELVQQILRFSRRDETDMHIISVAPLLKETTRLLRSTLPKTIRIEQQIQVEDDTIKGDSTQIHQVIMNLCTNAYHAMRDTGGVLTLTLENVRLLTPKELLSLKVPPGDYLKLGVHDTGQGIDPRTMQRIFEPYFTTKPVNEGTGLGLSVTLGIVRSHGGLIDLQTKIGEGTRFEVYFPVARAKSSETVKPEGKLPVGNGESILIVDDELFFLDIVRESLDQLGYRVTAHQSSVRALEAFKLDPDHFDILVTDQSMPEMSGVQLVAEVRKYSRTIPILLCTGFSETVSEESAQHYGISKFIMKPASIKDLAWAVHEALSLRCLSGGAHPH